MPEQPQPYNRQSIAQAVDVLRNGGVIACPTEGVFGLSCLPTNTIAVTRLLEIKQRDAAKGLILIASDRRQLQDWIAVPVRTIPEAIPEQPITWIVPAAAGVSGLVRGQHKSVAVRITINPVAAALCEAVDSPLISTSANLAGEPTISDTAELHRAFAGRVDYIVPGECGPANGPSTIIDLATGKQLR